MTMLEIFGMFHAQNWNMFQMEMFGQNASRHLTGQNQFQSMITNAQEKVDVNQLLNAAEMPLAIQKLMEKDLQQVKMLMAVRLYRVLHLVIH